MTEPTPELNKNLDEMTRLTLRVIELETSVSELSSDTFFIELRKTQEQLNILTKRLIALETEVNILRDARIRQIALNATFATKYALSSDIQTEVHIQNMKLKNTKPFWSFWK